MIAFRQANSLSAFPGHVSNAVESVNRYDCYNVKSRTKNFSFLRAAARHHYRPT